MRRGCTVLAVVLLGAGCQRDPEPLAGGKPLSHWKHEATQVSWMSFWNSEKDTRRREAFRRLVEIGEPAVPTLLELLKLNSAPVSGDAFNALTGLGPRAAGAVPELIQLLNDERLELRIRAAWTLGSIGPDAQPAVPSLTRLLQHPDSRLREVAARSLASIGGAADDVLDRARGSADPRQRAASMRGAASQAMDSASRREIASAGLADPDPAVRRNAVGLLLTSPRGDAEAMTEPLVEALNDGDSLVRRHARQVLAMYLQRGFATPRLLATVLKRGSADARANVAWHAGNGVAFPHRPDAAPLNPVVEDALLGALTDSDPRVRVYAARALAYGQGSPRARAIARLRQEVSQAEPILRVRAARVLWDVSHRVADVRPAYEAGLADTARWNRVETISAIMELGDDAKIFEPHLERLSSDPSPEVRDRAAKALYAIRLPATR